VSVLAWYADRWCGYSARRRDQEREPDVQERRKPSGFAAKNAYRAGGLACGSYRTGTMSEAAVHGLVGMARAEVSALPGTWSGRAVAFGDVAGLARPTFGPGGQGC
jgi:hypothetical protein